MTLPEATEQIIIDTDSYLERIGLRSIAGDRDVGYLQELQYQHLLSVPFENLDIHWKRPIILDTDRFYTKIVKETRGGFCYELNGLFIGLLRALGFEARLVSARVFGDGRGFGPDFDHAAIIVTSNDTQYLCDVGFGDFTSAPLQLNLDAEQTDRAGTFVIRGDGRHFEVSKRENDSWSIQYRFEDKARSLAEFAGMCDFQQYSSESHFTKGKVCSLLTGNGRKTLTDKKFVVATDGERTEMAVRSEAEFDRILANEFGITRPEANESRQT